VWSSVTEADSRDGNEFNRSLLTTQSGNRLQVSNINNDDLENGVQVMSGINRLTGVKTDEGNKEH